MHQQIIEKDSDVKRITSNSGKVTGPLYHNLQNGKVTRSTSQPQIHYALTAG